MKKIFLFLFLVICNFVNGQLSKIHYIPPIAASQGALPNQGQYIYISTPSVGTIDVLITPIGSPSQVVTVSNSNPYVFEIEDLFSTGRSQVSLVGNNTNETAKVRNDKGFIVESGESQIYVALRVKNPVHAGALVSKGNSALGTEFKAGGFTNYNSDNTMSTFISVMASEDGTQLTINNIDENVDIVDVDEVALGSTNNKLNDIVVNLDRGETYTIIALGEGGGDVPLDSEYNSNHTYNSDGLIGSNIVSTKPVVVNSGSLSGGFGLARYSRDFGFDQLVDESKVGKEYIFKKGTGNDEWENILLVATTDNTSITINGNQITNGKNFLKGINVKGTDPALSSKVISEGEYFLIEGDFYDVNENMYVESSEPVYAFQGIGSGASEANQGLFFVPPLKCSSLGDVNNIPIINGIGGVPFEAKLSIISKVGAIISITDNNNTNSPITGLTGGATSIIGTVTGNTNYVTYSVSGLEGDVSVFSDDELYVKYFNRNGFATSGGFYSGFDGSGNLSTNLGKIDASLDFCLPNANLVASGVESYDSFTWWFDDETGSGYSSTGVTTSPFSPALTGKYKIIAQKQCGSDPIQYFESSEITVSLCPPDYDLDGILDNIDLDIDNDGILNTTESNGDIDLDLSDFYNPVLNFSDSTSNTSSITSNITTTTNSSLIGSINGVATSTLGPGFNENLNFNLNFTEPTNLVFLTGITTRTIVFNESFSLSVLPNDKTLTLQNYNNILLVDTDFDGVYESGVTSFTSNEILFKYNSPGGNLIDPPSFSSRDITSLQTNHTNKNINATSTFVFNYKIKDRYLDTDNDGTPDYKDLDSDNDICYDTTEAGFTDNDNNGILGVSPVNVDLVGKVLGQGGYLTPLDTDSSTIFDFQEATDLVSITSHPTSVSICVSDTNSFSVVTTDPDDSIYQWQVFNGVIWEDIGFGTPEANYTGVNSATLVVQPLNTSLNNKRYRVKTRKLNTQCETISDEATIGVFSPSILVSPTSFSERENADNITLGVSLTGTPSSNVYLDFVNIDNTEIAVSLSTLTFTPINWNVTQTITIDPQLDFILDGNQNFNLGLSVNTTSTLNCYNNLPNISIPTEIIDIDQVGFTIVSIDNLTDESGDEGSFSVVMNSKPTGFVDLILNSSDLTEGSVQATVTFSPLNWNIPQIITVTGLPDPIPIQDGAINYQIITGVVSSSDANYSTIDPATIADVAMTNQDLDGVGVEVNVVGFDSSTGEDGDTLIAEFNLTTLPLLSADVTIPLSIVGDLGEVSLSTTSITILNANWNSPNLNRVTLTGLDDDIIDGDIALKLETGDPRSSDPAYDNLNASDVADVDFVNIDDDNPGFSVGPISNDLNETGNQANFFVVLNSRPNTPVQLNISTNDRTESEVDVSFSTILFNPDEWNIPQNVYLNSVNDDIIDGDKTSTILISVDISSDPNFFGLEDQSINVLTIDDDESNVLITEIDLLTSEDEDQGFFEILLTSRPDSSVIVNFSSSNLNEGTVIPQITFDSSNWDEPQLVYVTGVDDFPPVTDGPQKYDIIISSVFSLDLNYGTIDPNAFDPIEFTNQDNDSPAVIVKVMNDDYTTSEDLDSVIIGFKLTSEPLSWVDIPLSIGSNSDEVKLVENIVRIEKENWDNFSLNQVTLTGIDDSIIDGDQKFEFITASPVSLDLFYGILNADDVADINLVNKDNDFPFLNVSEPEILSEDKNSTNISISLGNKPTGKVKIVFELTDLTEVSINKLEIEFDEFNWNIAQELTLFGVDDPFLDGDVQSNLILKIHPNTEDFNYLKMQSASVELVTLDNEKDSDSDGAGDEFDNCPDVSNPNQNDFDGDGIGDACDEDIDGDGVPNKTETIDNTSNYDACSFMPMSVTLPITVSVDCDSDGVDDKDDIDDDNDGILDILEGFEDIDGDGLPNSVDLDSDNDGCYDAVEAGFSDEDNDGILGIGPVIFDNVGRVLNQGGYTQPMDRSGNGIPDFKEYGEEIFFILQPTSRQVNGSTLEIEAQININEYAGFRWQENTGDKENPSWRNISNDSNYSGVNSSILEIRDKKRIPSGREFRLVVKNLSNICYADLISDVVTFGKVDLFIPNAFSPDGDGVNDTWEIRGIEKAIGYKLIIFNRWGIKVYETNNYKNDWAGTSQTDSFMSRDNLLPEGTYFYSIIWGDETEPNRGFVYIKRKDN